MMTESMKAPEEKVLPSLILLPIIAALAGAGVMGLLVLLGA
jgi:hypothetical protein